MARFESGEHGADGTAFKRFPLFCGKTYVKIWGGEFLWDK